MNAPVTNRAQEEIDRAIAAANNQLPPFTAVPIADLDTFEPPAPIHAWEGLVPSGHVTLWNSHGGGGKTTVCQMLSASVAAGQPLFGIPVRAGGAVFYSGEDAADRLRYQLRLVCRQLGLSASDLADRLHILDATEAPALFAEVTVAGRKEGITTAAYDALRAFLTGKDVRLLVIDNASDVFDASEIERAKVRAFMRALARLAREFDLAVILLAHVDKWTSRGERTGTEAYTGSTAWHNSARSRLFMYRDKDGTLVIEHQKHNLGPLHDPIRLVWPHGALPQLDEQFGPVVQGIADRNHEKALLRLIAEFSERGEHVSTATTSRTHAGKVLRQEPTFPSIKDAEVFDLLRKAERAGRLTRMAYKGADRKTRECWALTAAGREFAGLAATAATAATTQVTALGAPAADACGDCGDFAARGCGGKERTQESPQ